MKKIKYPLASLFWAILCLPILISAQENQSSQWIRVQSDNGEFSIESPVGYDFYGDKDGFSVSSGNSYQLTEMRMLNCYHEKTLMSFETYKTDSPKEVADILADRDGENGEKSVNKIGKSKIRQVLIKNENFYAVRRFYVSKNYLYVLTAASREGETASIKRFLNSLAFKTSELQIEPAQVTDSNVKTVLFSNLKFSQLEIEKNPAPLKKVKRKNAVQPTPENDNNSLPVAVIFKPFPSYTEAARKNSEAGRIKIRLTFSKNGSITKVGFLSTLNDGLNREAVFAAIRLKFMPAEKNGKPVVVTKVVEYSFSIR